MPRVAPGSHKESKAWVSLGVLPDPWARRPGASANNLGGTIARPTTYPVFGQAEDLFLAILRDYFQHRPDITVRERYAEGMTLPLIVPTHRNRAGVVGYMNPHDRWLRSAIMEVSTFIDGPDRDQMNGYLQEACRHALFDAQEKQIEYPGIGVINQIQGGTYARPENDWATTTHAVQYAKLPNNVSRYETTYRLLVRPSTTFVNPFLTTTEGPNRPSKQTEG